MTYTKKRVLPALHQSGKVSKPDLQSIGNSNYTDTILRYNNLAVKFPQLETNAKTIVEAINELYRRPSGEAELFYYSYTNSQDIIIRPTSPTPVGGVIETESGETLETESGETLETEQSAGDNSDSSSTSNDAGEVEIASITFEYKKKTSVKIETEFNMLAYPSSSAWGTNSGAFWYQLYYYYDDELISYTPYETISYWNSSSDDRVCKICRDFFYHLEEIESGEHIFKITAKVGGLDYAKIPAKNCNVILNDLGTLLNPAPEPWDGRLELSDTLPTYSYAMGSLAPITDSFKVTDPASQYPGVLLARITAPDISNTVTNNYSSTYSVTAAGEYGDYYLTFKYNYSRLAIRTTWSSGMVPRYLFGSGTTWDITFRNMNARFTSTHGILFGFKTQNAQNGGFMWHRQTNRFGVWDNETLWQDSDITDKNYFANSVLRIYVDRQGYWHISKDGVLIFEPPIPLGEHNRAIASGNCGVGYMASNYTTFYDMEVKEISVWYYGQ